MCSLGPFCLGGESTLTKIKCFFYVKRYSCAVCEIIIRTALLFDSTTEMLIENVTEGGKKWNNDPDVQSLTYRWTNCYYLIVKCCHWWCFAHCLSMFIHEFSMISFGFFGYQCSSGEKTLPRVSSEFQMYSNIKHISAPSPVYDPCVVIEAEKKWGS